ncbi:hypothetical protein JCM8097_007612 [Rhodosporidiobolus ruineniae]
MASSSRRRRSSKHSLFDRLPLELLKVIVGMVHAQDKAFLESHVDVARPDIEEEDEEVDTVTFAQLANPYFRYKLAQDKEICGIVKNVKLASATSTQIVKATAVLHLLPNVDCLTFDGSSAGLMETLDAAKPGDFGPRSLAGPSLRTFFSRAARAEFALAGDAGSATIRLFEALNPTLIRHLALKPTSGAFSLQLPDNGLALALQRFDRLMSFELLDHPVYGLSNTVDSSWRDNLRLPTVETLTMRVGSRFGEILPFLQHAAPNLRKLELRDFLGFQINSPEKFVFPRLSQLSIVGAPASGMDTVFQAFASSPLVSLAIRATEPSYFACGQYLYTLDKYFPKLRFVTYDITSATRPDDIAAYTAELAASGVDFRCRWLPDVSCLGPDIVEGPYPHCPMYDREHDSWRDAARQTLEWALDRLDHARGAGDLRFQDEFAMAVLRLRERQLIEMQ